MYFKINLIFFLAVCVYIADAGNSNSKEGNKNGHNKDDDDRNFEDEQAPDDNVIHPPKRYTINPIFSVFNDYIRTW
jgi:hypothetical protein